MNGMEMMISAVLKATGFSREQLDQGIAKGEAKLKEFDARLTGIESNIGEILALLRKEGKDVAAVAESVATDA